MMRQTCKGAMNMRRFLLILLAMLLMILPAAAEDIEIQPEGYTYIGTVPAC